MSVIGRFVKRRFPSLYHFLIGQVNTLISFSQPYSIYITDNLGGSFKSFFVKEDLLLKIEMLERNLDEESIQVVKVIIQRLQLYPDAKYRIRISKKNAVVGGLLPVETKPQIDLIESYLHSLQAVYRVPPKLMEASVFYFYHGLTLLPQFVHQYIKSQHFIDVGAFVGDSAIALSKYGYSKIFSLEISLKSIARYSENMNKNGISKEKYEVLNFAVAASDEEPPLTIYDTGSAGLSLLRSAGKYDEIHVVRKTIDAIVKQNAIHPKFIKVDIEGAALDFVKGAANTLIQFRPVVSIAIYHNPYEFFEIKPMLEHLLKNYTFMIRKLSPGIRNNLIHSEVVLLGYPNELISN
ncbi:hypothetical protein WSM22_29580 [Cytophagales bacterium WSM2-2]|nr:hypothetical protein WSM22_29580 [Cytophagales bacterium WSM2-2]